MKKLTEYQQMALAKVKEDWHSAHGLFNSHLVRRDEFTAETLYSKGYLKRRIATIQTQYGASPYFEYCLVNKVQSFKPDHRYRFIKDYNYEPPYPLKRLECREGDIALFKGKSLGYGNFYIKDRNDPEGRSELLILKPQEAFELLEECENKQYKDTVERGVKWK